MIYEFFYISLMVCMCNGSCCNTKVSCWHSHSLSTEGGHSPSLVYGRHLVPILHSHRERERDRYLFIIASSSASLLCVSLFSSCFLNVFLYNIPDTCISEVLFPDFIVSSGMFLVRERTTNSVKVLRHRYFFCRVVFIVENLSICYCNHFQSQLPVPLLWFL